MSDKKYPPGGALFPNGMKKTESHPDFRGTLEISTDLLKVLLAQAKAGESIKMDLGAWKKQSAKGGFLSLKASPPYIKAQEAPKQEPWGAVGDDSDDIPF